MVPVHLCWTALDKPHFRHYRHNNIFVIVLQRPGLSSAACISFNSSSPSRCAHTQPLIFHRKKEGVPPPSCLPFPDRSVSTSPSLSLLYLSLSLSLFFQHMPVVMLMASGSASLSGCPSCPFPSRRWCIITVVWLVEWLWSADRGVCLALRHVLPSAFGTGDWPHWAQTAVGQTSLHRMHHSPSITSRHSILSGFLLIVFSRRFHHERPITISRTVAWSRLQRIYLQGTRRCWLQENWALFHNHSPPQPLITERSKSASTVC